MKWPRCEYFGERDPARLSVLEPVEVIIPTDDLNSWKGQKQITNALSNRRCTRSRCRHCVRL